MNRPNRTYIPMATLLLGLTIGSVGCWQDPSERAVTQPPTGEIWIADEQLQRAQIQTTPIAERDIERSILTTGRISFDDELVTHIFSPVTGRIARIQAKLGNRVQRGDSLAVIQSPDVGQATSDLGKAEADLIAANHDLERKRDLFSTHAASGAEVEMAEDNYRKAKAEKARALQKASLFHAAHMDVTQGYLLKSPIDGEVIARTVNPGAEIQGQYGGGTAVELFTVGELDRVWALADVFEMDLRRIRAGQPVSVEVVTHPGRTFVGVVDWISGVIDPATRTTKVRCVLDNSDRALRPEMFATVTISLGRESTLAIPRAAVLRLGNETVVFVEEGDAPGGKYRFRKVAVAVDENDADEWIQAPAGLRKGQVLATSNAIMLSGML